MSAADSAVGDAFDTYPAGSTARSTPLNKRGFSRWKGFEITTVISRFEDRDLLDFDVPTDLSALWDCADLFVGSLPAALRSLEQDIVSPSELLAAVEVDLDPPALGTLQDPDARPERRLQRLLRLDDVGVAPLDSSAIDSRRLPPGPRPPGLDLAHRQTIPDCPVRQLLLILGGRQAEERPSVTHRELPRPDLLLDLIRQSQQPQRVRDGRSLLADAGRKLLLG